MIRSIGLFCVLCLLSILTSCHTTSPADQDLPPYNPNVEAFTTGKISRYSPVYLIFNQEVKGGSIWETRAPQARCAGTMGFRE